MIGGAVVPDWSTWTDITQSAFLCFCAAEHDGNGIDAADLWIMDRFCILGMGRMLGISLGR